VIRSIVTLAGIALIAGCAAQQPAPQPTPAPAPRHDPAPPPRTEYRPVAGERIADIVLSMVGTPYRFGGTTPRGFDCSGLVFYAYDRVGIAVPRTAADQRRAARSVRPQAMQPGDLLFFDTRWKAGHVGVYVGDGRFVHAPSSGKRVSVERLDRGYYAGRLEHAGRLH
jgi:cell wall-associated NlpC family hydrolase